MVLWLSGHTREVFLTGKTDKRFPVHTMRAHRRSRSTTPFILKFVTIWRHVVRYTFQPPLLLGWVPCNHWMEDDVAFCGRFIPCCTEF